MSRFIFLVILLLLLLSPIISAGCTNSIIMFNQSRTSITLALFIDLVKYRDFDPLLFLKLFYLIFILNVQSLIAKTLNDKIKLCLLCSYDTPTYNC